jgi:hypothetical protein
MPNLTDKYQRDLKLVNDMRKGLQDIILERFRQNDKWGEQNHGLTAWSAILAEECGEFAEAALGVLFQDGETPQRSASLADARKEAIHCAAVALAIIECIDRHAQPTP